MSANFKPQDISPTRGEKFSTNLHRYIKRRGARTNNVFKAEDGTLWIGDVDGHWFHGSRLMSILCGVRGAGNACAFPGAPDHWKLKELKNFWPDYLKIGRCAIDPDHHQHFMNSEGRYIQKGRHRVCQWCGQKQAMTIKRSVIKHEQWSNEPTGKECK